MAGDIDAAADLAAVGMLDGPEFGTQATRLLREAFIMGNRVAAALADATTRQRPGPSSTPSPR